MTLGLANAILWPFLALAAVPLLLHLFARVKPPVYRFSSVAFIRQLVRRRLRVRRPQEWLLLAVRTALFVALVLVFLQPLLFGQRRLAGLGTPRNVMLVVDATASMRYVDGAQTRLARAAAAASEIISGLRAGDSANIIWLRREPQAVFPEAGSNFDYLREVLRRAGGTSEAGDIGAALRLAREQLGRCQGRKELCVMSDFQSSAWATADLAVEEDVDLLLVPAGGSPGENCALADIRAVPSRPLAGEEVTISCEVCNYSGQPQQRQVFLEFGENRAAQDLQLPAWGKGTAVFRQRVAGPGPVPLEAALASDRFPADDRRWTVIEVRDRLRVGLVPGNPASAAVWRRVLRAFGWAQVEELTAEQLAPAADLDGVVFCGWTGAAPDVLDRLAAAGVTVLCEPARANPGGWPDSTGAPPAEPAVWEQARTPWPVRVADVEHPVFRIFTEGDFGSPATGAFTGRVRFGGALPARCRALLAYPDGQPALLQGQPRENVYWWNLALEPAYSDLSRQPQLVSLVGELFQQARRGVAGAGGGAAVECGRPVTLALDLPVAREDLELVSAAGEKLRIADQPTAGAPLVSVASPEPGLYTWKAQGKTLGYSVVDFPAVESDLRVAVPTAKGPAPATVLAGAQELRRLHQGSSLWPLCLALAVLLVVSEGLVLRWADRS